MSNNHLNAEQALSAVCDALYVLAKQRGQAAVAITESEEFDAVKSAAAVGEQGGVADAYSLAVKMLDDHRKSVRP